jgi:hypothetical protein
MKLFPFKHPKKNRAQAIVEFMLALPVLLMLLYGIIEVGRLIFIFSSVANASRQAARYGSASGQISNIPVTQTRVATEPARARQPEPTGVSQAAQQNGPASVETDDNVAFYQDCEGIRAVANQSAFIITFDEINITYDRGINPDGSSIPIAGVDPNPEEDSCPIADYTVRNGDRIIVQVSSTYEPIIKLLPLKPLRVVSASARSFLISVPIVGNALPTGFAAETTTPSPVPTVITATFPPTITPTITATFIPTSVNMPHVTPATTMPPHATPTPTNTALIPPTFTPITPTATATSISCTGLTGVSHGPLIIDENAMRMLINNQTGHTLTTAQIYLEWNHDTGHESETDRGLRLRQIVFDRQIWNGDIESPSAYIPAFYPTIPPGESMVQFIFHQSYDVIDGTERVIVNISNPGCINYPVDSSH